MKWEDWGVDDPSTSRGKGLVPAAAVIPARQASYGAVAVKTSGVETSSREERGALKAGVSTRKPGTDMKVNG